MNCKTIAALTMAAAICSLPAAAVAADADGPFEVTTLGEGVRLFGPRPGDASRTNSLVVELDDGLLVLDAQSTPSVGAELVEAIRRTSPKPIRYLVYSHPHADAVGGAASFPPSTIVVASEGCRSALDDPEFDVGAEAAERAGEGWSPPPRVPPELIITARTRISGGGTPVDLLPVAPAHAPGDLVVHIPETGVLAVGDLLFPDRNPYGRSATLKGWINVLNGILNLSPTRVVALRGPVGEINDLRRQRDSLAWLRGQMAVAFIRRVTEERVLEWVRSDKQYRDFFAEDATFLPYLVEVGIEEERADRRKRGLE